MRHYFQVVCGVVLFAFGGCTVHVGYTPKLYLSQTDHFQNDQATSTQSEVQFLYEPYESNKIIQQTERQHVPEKPCDFPPRPAFRPIPEPIQLVSPDIDNAEEALEVLAAHVLRLREFIKDEREREIRYHRQLKAVCGK